ncbi:MAG: extracellular solute-binding protein [Eubacteriales bacterium]|nr:extracellular solute-binding protein [Eubacteriales bacterium]MDD4718152.1 extracellular solute-binding protein [Eubacteriales bacterium]
MKKRKVLVLMLTGIIMIAMLITACDQEPAVTSGIGSALESSGQQDETSSSVISGDESGISSSVIEGSEDGQSEVLSDPATESSSVYVSKEPITVSEAEEEIKKLDLKGASITMLAHWDPNGADARLVKTRFKNYCNGNIIFVNAPYEKLGEKLSSMIMGGDSPDIYAVRNWDFPALMYKDVFQELDDKIDFNSSIWVGDKPKYDQYLWKGKHYIIGGASPAYFIWYNKRLMEEYGVDKNPGQLAKENKWDWDAFLEIAKEMTDPEENLYGFSDGGGSLIYALMSGLGEDIIKFTDQGIESNVKSANVAKAHQFYSDLYNKHKVVNTSPNSLQDFANRKSAMLYGGNWEAQQDPIKTMHDAGEVTFTHIPKAPGASGYIYPGSVGGYAIPKGAKNVKGAVAFLTMGQVSQAYAEEERAAWHKNANRTPEEIIIVDQAGELANLPTYSYGINAASTAYWQVLDSLRNGGNWSTLSEQLEPKVNQAIADLMK